MFDRLLIKATYLQIIQNTTDATDAHKKIKKFGLFIKLEKIIDSMSSKYLNDQN